MAFKQLILDNVANTTSKTISLRSSSTVLSCVTGSCDIIDVSDGGSSTLTSLVADGREILDFYPGADIQVVATSAGTTVTFGKTAWKDQ